MTAATNDEVRVEDSGSMLVLAASDLSQEKLGGEFAHLIARLSDGGDRDQALGRQVVVVVADDARSSGNWMPRSFAAPIAPMASVSDAQMMPSIDSGPARRYWAALRPAAILRLSVSTNAQLHAGLDGGLLGGLQTMADGTEIEGTADEGQPGAALGDQVLGG